MLAILYFCNHYCNGYFIIMYNKVFCNVFILYVYIFISVTEMDDLESYFSHERQNV
jgi:hypothetical protein